jgi:acetyltransferase-like isoleucine patch superfamily enzyme
MFRYIYTKLYAPYKRLIVRLRSKWYQSVLPGHPKGLRVTGPITVSPPENLFLGSNVVLNEGVYINSRLPVYIGNDVHISPFSQINTGFLKLNNQDRPHGGAPVHIGNNVWIAAGVIINPGVTIHDGAVVGSGAVVTRDLPANTVCAGVPAKPIKTI